MKKVLFLLLLIVLLIVACVVNKYDGYASVLLDLFVLLGVCCIPLLDDKVF